MGRRYGITAIRRYPTFDPIIDKIGLIGNDLGDLAVFYGEGEDGFRLYRTTAGSLGFRADQIADTLTDFLVNGADIDISITL